jgi:hypothetical protein
MRFLVTWFQDWLDLWKNCRCGLAHVHPGVLVCAVMSKYMFPAFYFYKSHVMDWQMVHFIWLAQKEIEEDVKLKVKNKNWKARPRYVIWFKWDTKPIKMCRRGCNWQWRQVRSDNILTDYLKSISAEASTGMNHLLLFWFVFLAFISRTVIGITYDQKGLQSSLHSRLQRCTLITQKNNSLKAAKCDLHFGTLKLDNHCLERLQKV